MKIVLPDYIDQIIQLLEQAGHEAYIVGGCVRDSLLFRCPKDWDVTTSARPEQVKSIFNRTVDTGIEHGTVTVLWEDESCEVTTYRIDGDYTDSRHPDQVTFSSQLKEDVERRDFTVNALAYHPQRGLVDLVGGLNDLRMKRIKCVGRPRDRFREDALRMLRAWRFCAQLSFLMDEETKCGIDFEKQRLSLVSVERIQVELLKIIQSTNPAILIDMMNQGLFEYIIKEIQNQSKSEDWKEQLEIVLSQSPIDKVIRLALLLDFIPDLSQISKIFRRLHFDNETRIQVIHLVELMKCETIHTLYDYKKLWMKYGQMTMNRRIVLMGLKKQQEAKIEVEEGFYYYIIKEKEPIFLKDLTISGKDLINIGFKKGIFLGEVLNELLDHIHQHPKDNHPSILLSIAQEKYGAKLQKKN